MEVVTGCWKEGVSPVDRLEALMFAALQIGEEVNIGFCRELKTQTQLTHRQWAVESLREQTAI